MHKNMVTKIIALVTAITFILPTITWAFDSPAIVGAYCNTPLLVISKSLGQIKREFHGQGKTIICIQDLHCNAEVQHNISKIIGHVAKEAGEQRAVPLLVAEEGATGVVNVDVLRDFPVPWIAAEVGDYFVKQGKLTGPEHFAATGKEPIRLIGNETQALYDESLKTVRLFLNAETQGYVYDLREALDELKPGIYHGALQKYDQQFQAFHAGKLDLLQFSLFLKQQAKYQNVELREFPNLNHFLELKQNQFSPEISADDLLKEIERLDAKVREQLYASQEEQELDKLYQRLSIIEKLLNISATPEEVKIFREQREAYKVKTFFDFIQTVGAIHELPLPDQEIFALDGYLQKAEAFYCLADLRSLKFVDNLLQQMDARHETLAVMVNGGFHIEGITAELKRRNLSFISIQPSLTRQDRVNPYFSLLQGKQLPLEKLLEKNQSILAVPSWPQAMRNIFNRCCETTIKALARNIPKTTNLEAALTAYAAKHNLVVEQEPWQAQGTPYQNLKNSTIFTGQDTVSGAAIYLLVADSRLLRAERAEAASQSLLHAEHVETISEHSSILAFSDMTKLNAAAKILEAAVPQVSIQKRVADVAAAILESFITFPIQLATFLGVPGLEKWFAAAHPEYKFNALASQAKLTSVAWSLPVALATGLMVLACLLASHHAPGQALGWALGTFFSVGVASHMPRHVKWNWLNPEYAGRLVQEVETRVENIAETILAAATYHDPMVPVPHLKDIAANAELPAGCQYASQAPTALRNNKLLDERNCKLVDKLLAYWQDNTGFLSEDSPVTRNLQYYLDQMQIASGRKERLRVLVAVNTEEENAFAIPDGTIIVTWAMIAKFQGGRIGELVALLSHERGHIVLRHAEMCQAMHGTFWEEYIKTWGVRRIFEMEADQTDLEIMIALGFKDPFQALMNMLGRLGEGGVVHGGNDQRSLLTLVHMKKVDYSRLVKKYQSLGVKFNDPEIPREYFPTQIFPDKVKRLRMADFGPDWVRLLEGIQNQELWNRVFETLVKGPSLEKIDCALGDLLHRIRAVVPTEKVIEAGFDPEAAAKQLRFLKSLLLYEKAGAKMLGLAWSRENHARLESKYPNIYSLCQDYLHALDQDRVSTDQDMYRCLKSLLYMQPEELIKFIINYDTFLFGEVLLSGGFPAEIIPGKSVTDPDFFNALYEICRRLEPGSDFLKACDFFISPFLNRSAQATSAEGVSIVQHLRATLLTIAQSQGKKFTLQEAENAFGSPLSEKIIPALGDALDLSLSGVHASLLDIVRSRDQQALLDFMGYQDGFSETALDQFSNAMLDDQRHPQFAPEDLLWMVSVIREQADYPELRFAGDYMGENGYQRVCPEGSKPGTLQKGVECLNFITQRLSPAQRFEVTRIFLEQHSGEIAAMTGLDQVYPLVRSTIGCLQRQVLMDEPDEEANASRLAFGDLALISPLFSKFNHLLQTSAQLSHLEGIEMATDVVGMVYGRRPAGAKGRHNAVDQIKNATAVLGYSQESTQYLATYREKLLQQLKALLTQAHPDLQELEEGMGLAQMIPFLDSRQTLEQEITRLALSQLPIVDAVQFIENRIQNNQVPSLVLVNDFIENRLTRREDLKMVGSRLKQAYQTLRSSGSYTLTGAVFLDHLLSEWIEVHQSDLMSLFSITTSNGRQDHDLRQKLVPVWLEYIAFMGVVSDYRIGTNEQGELEISGMGKNHFLTFDGFMEMIYQAKDWQKMVWLGKLLLDQGLLADKGKAGGMSTRKQLAKEVGSRLQPRNQAEQALAQFIQQALASFLQNNTAATIAFPVMQLVLPDVLNRPPADQGVRKKLTDSGFMLLPRALLDIVSSNSVAHNQYRINLQTAKNHFDQVIRLQTDHSADIGFSLELATLTRPLAIAESRSQKAATAENAPPTSASVSPVDAIVRIASSLGGVWLRLTQIYGHFMEGSVVDKRKLSAAYDDSPSLNKMEFYENLERLAAEDPEIQEFLDHQLVAILEKKGGGSCYTVYRALIRTPDGERHVVLKLLNPNADLFVEKSAEMLRRIIEDLKEETQYAKELELAERLLRLAENWTQQEIQDDSFLRYDENFRRLETFVASNDVHVGLPELLQPSNLRLKIEEEIQGQTINRLENRADLPPEKKTALEKAVAAAAEGFVRMLTVEARPGTTKPYLMHPDIHPGNAVVTPAGDVKWIDLGFYQELSLEEARLLLAIATAGRIDSVFDAIRLAIKFPFLAKMGWRNLWKQFTTAKKQAITMEELMHQFRNAGAEITPEIELGIKNIIAMNRMLTDQGLPSLSHYVSTASTISRTGFAEEHAYTMPLWEEPVFRGLVFGVPALMKDLSWHGLLSMGWGSISAMLGTSIFVFAAAHIIVTWIKLAKADLGSWRKALNPRNFIRYAQWQDLIDFGKLCVAALFFTAAYLGILALGLQLSPDISKYVLHAIALLASLIVHEVWNYGVKHNWPGLRHMLVASMSADDKLRFLKNIGAHARQKLSNEQQMDAALSGKFAALAASGRLKLKNPPLNFFWDYETMRIYRDLEVPATKIKIRLDAIRQRLDEWLFQHMADQRAVSAALSEYSNEKMSYQKAEEMELWMASTLRDAVARTLVQPQPQALVENITWENIRQFALQVECLPPAARGRALTAARWSELLGMDFKQAPALQPRLPNHETPVQDVWILLVKRFLEQSPGLASPEFKDKIADVLQHQDSDYEWYQCLLAVLVGLKEEQFYRRVLNSLIDDFLALDDRAAGELRLKYDVLRLFVRHLSVFEKNGLKLSYLEWMSSKWRILDFGKRTNRQAVLAEFKAALDNDEILLARSNYGTELEFIKTALMKTDELARLAKIIRENEITPREMLLYLSAKYPAGDGFQGTHRQEIIRDAEAILRERGLQVVTTYGPELLSYLVKLMRDNEPLAGGLMGWFSAWYVSSGMQKYAAAHPQAVEQEKIAEQERLARRYQQHAWYIEEAPRAVAGLVAFTAIVAGMLLGIVDIKQGLVGMVFLANIIAWGCFPIEHLLPENLLVKRRGVLQYAPTINWGNVNISMLIAAVNIIFSLVVASQWGVNIYTLAASLAFGPASHWFTNRIARVAEEAKKDPARLMSLTDLLGKPGLEMNAEYYARHMVGEKIYQNGVKIDGNTIFGQPFLQNLGRNVRLRLAWTFKIGYEMGQDGQAYFVIRFPVWLEHLLLEKIPEQGLGRWIYAVQNRYVGWRLERALAGYARDLRAAGLATMDARVQAYYGQWLHTRDSAYLVKMVGMIVAEQARITMETGVGATGRSPLRNKMNTFFRTSPLFWGRTAPIGNSHGTVIWAPRDMKPGDLARYLRLWPDIELNAAAEKKLLILRKRYLQSVEEGA